MSDNIQATIAGRTPPCLQQTIEKTRYLVEVHLYVSIYFVFLLPGVCSERDGVQTDADKGVIGRNAA